MKLTKPMKPMEPVKPKQPKIRPRARWSLKASLRRALVASWRDRVLVCWLALFIACRLADLLLTAVGMRLGLFPVNPVFCLLLFRGVPLGAALWIGLTLSWPPTW